MLAMRGGTRCPSPTWCHHRCHRTRAPCPGLVPCVESPLLSLKPLTSQVPRATLCPAEPSSLPTLVPPCPAPWSPRVCAGACRWHLVVGDTSPGSLRGHQGLAGQDMGEDGHGVPKAGGRSRAAGPVGSRMALPRVPPLGSVTSLAPPGVDWCPVFLLSSPDVPQLPTPHVHSTPAPPPGPSQPISHASMASAPSFTPAPIQGTVSSFSVSLWTRCSPARPEELHRRTVAQAWPGDSPAGCPAWLRSLGVCGFWHFPGGAPGCSWRVVAAAAP